MYFSSKTLFVVSLPLLLLSSCEDFDFEKHYPDYGDKLKKEYTKNWIKEFGEIDPNQDWNMATRAEITVGAAGDYQIFAKSTGKIVGDYKNVSAGAKLGVDVLETEEELIVSNGSVAEIVKIGGVVFNGTRSAHINSDGTIDVSYYLDSAGNRQYYEFIKDDSSPLSELLGENEFNIGNEKVTEDFQYVSTGEFVIYPIFWNTSAQNTIGIYYKDETANETKYIPVFTAHTSSDDVEWITSQGGKPGDPELQYLSRVDVTTGEEIWTNVVGEGQNVNSNRYFEPPFNVSKYRSLGIKISIPVGTVFGMYLDNVPFSAKYDEEKKLWEIYYYSVNSTRIHSEKALNSEDKLLSADKHIQNGIPVNSKMSYVGTVTIGDNMYLSFEDWPAKVNNGSDFDLNDMIFKIGGNKPIPVVKDPVSWILACEDLGSTDDIDFNDLVLKVTHTSGQTTAKIQPLAAGGTLQSRYCFGTEKMEIHHAFGESDYETGKYPMINTGSTKNGKTLSLPQPTTWTVSKSFSLSTDDIGGIFIEVDQNDGQKDVKTITIKPTDKGTDAAPQMILVPDTWKWPKEREWIYDAYPDFNKWSGDAVYTDWVKDCKTELIYNN